MRWVRLRESWQVRRRQAGEEKASMVARGRGREDMCAVKKEAGKPKLATASATQENML